MFKSLYDSSSEKGKRFLALTVNRIETTLLHYDSWIELTAMEELISPYSKKSELSEEICAEIKKCADRAMIYAKKYMIKHCEIMPDRGAEGNLSSYNKTMIYYIDHIKRKYSGIPLPDLYESVPLDPPPAPGER